MRDYKAVNQNGSAPHMKNKVKILLIVFFLMILSPGLFAQFYNGSQVSFGKNRVQYNDYLWSFMRFDKFDTYFYLNGKPLAIYTAKYANKYIREMQSRFDFDLDDNIQFIIFNKLSDLKESNIGLISDEQYNIGGVTYLVGSKVFIYYDGSHKNFETQIKAGISNVIFNQMMYGGKFSSNMKNTMLLSLPNWFSQGLISYMSDEWNTELDNIVRDAIVSDRYNKFNNITGTDAVYAGHSIWNFIASRYGKSTIPNIIYMSKISRSVENGFLYVLGISFSTLLEEWRAYYKESFEKVKHFDNPEENTHLLKKIKKDRIYSKLKISPNGRFAAFTTNELDQHKVWIYDLETKKTKKIMKAGYKLEEKADESYPLLAWHPNGKVLSIITETKGNILLHYYTIETKKMEAKEMHNFDKIVDFSYSHDGKFLALSAVQKGQTDIFVYTLSSNTIEQITKDIYDDFHPRFFMDSKYIIFSSNRLHDTIKHDIETHKKDYKELLDKQDYNDLFIYSFNSKDPLLKRITNTPWANEKEPVVYDKMHFSYLSDKNGIYNRYVGSLDSSISFVDTITHYRYFTRSFPVTDYNRNIIEHDISTKAKKTAEIIYSGGVYKMYVEDLPLSKNINASVLQHTHYMNYLIKGPDREERDSVIKARDIKEETKKRFINVHFDENSKKESKSDTSNIDIENYEFNNESLKDLKDNSKNDSIVKINIDPKDSVEFILPKQRNYNVEYSINKIVNQLDFTYLNNNYQAYTGGGSPIFNIPGLNAFFKVGAIDLMEDYRITGGFRLSADLNNNEYIISFENLKKRMDKEIVFHRKSVEDIQSYSIIRTYSHELYYMLKWPFDKVISLRGTARIRNDDIVFLSTDLANLKEPNVNNTWAGLKLEYVYDNTRAKGLNLFYGTRYKLFAEYFNLLGENEDLFVIGLDYRRYIKIHRTFIWANRFAASTSFGSQKLIYYLGGVDNDLFPKFNQDIPIDRDQNYAFQTLATNMRGFDQNIRNGNSFAVINSELRFPVFAYFSRKPIKSEFLRNFQLIGFGDVGSAWTGSNPYSGENALFEKV